MATKKELEAEVKRLERQLAAASAQGRSVPEKPESTAVHERKVTDPGSTLN